MCLYYVGICTVTDIALLFFLLLITVLKHEYQLKCWKDFDFYLPDFSISSPKSQKYPPDLYVPHISIRIKSVEEIEDKKKEN